MVEPSTPQRRQMLEWRQMLPIRGIEPGLWMQVAGWGASKEVALEAREGLPLFLRRLRRGEVD